MFIQNYFKRLLLFSLLPGFSLILVGCGGSSEEDKQRADITVTVTHDGAPVSEAELRLMMDGKGEGAMGLLDDSGQTELSDVVLGSYTVTVTPPEGTPDNPAPQKEYPNIPAQYRSLQNSPLKAEINAGSNEFTFELN
ncbi:carboxypeptidase-like regulatory domain-containing protein [Gimesia algae]|uniref:Carboxypeptidase regulatory-like domain-containing protein n=1 Tax=Gimesia algae TaxID=2527971 RepID=A0A517VM74_9PLAN|nr:carboxypeptidase-like regulatory domain-containing protein [Gimesia algae]QDT94114.1 hypothetical protein Pan161_58070 [Gimesia algae]